MESFHDWNRESIKDPATTISLVIFEILRTVVLWRFLLEVSNLSFLSCFQSTANACFKLYFQSAAKFML